MWDAQQLLFLDSLKEQILNVVAAAPKLILLVVTKKNIMDKKFIRNFRDAMRIFDREVYYQNNASCCNGISLAQCHTLLEIEKSKEISKQHLALISVCFFGLVHPDPL